MTTYIRLEAIRRAMRNHSAALIWVDGIVKCAS